MPRVTVRYDPLGAVGTADDRRDAARHGTVTQDAEHLTIKFDADALDVPNPPLPAPGSPGLILGVRIVDATTLAVDLGPRFAGFRATSQPVDTTMRLVIDLVAAQTDAPAARRRRAGRRRSRRRPTCRRRSASRRRPSARSRSIPGHGGDDEGVQERRRREGKGSDAGGRPPRQRRRSKRGSASACC